MTPSETIPLTVDEEHGGLELTLRRFKPANGTAARGAVLLLHGGNSAGDTFLLPNGGLTAFLTRDGFDVWILDWRTSPHVVNPLIASEKRLGGSLQAERELFALDHAAQTDIPRALEEIRRHVPSAELGVVGHCMGGGAASIAIATGKFSGFGVRNVVLSTLGLFYEVPWNGWMKAEDFIVERIPQENPDCRGVDPRTPGSWPRAMTEAFGYWPAGWLPSGTTPAARMLQHLTFMFGQPYDVRRLHPNISERELLAQFGAMHVGLFLHAAELVRPRHAGNGGGPVPGHYLVPQHFHDHRITLLNATDNQLWHRDAVDLMHDWLRDHGVHSEKRNYAGYRIQELFWGARAERDVYPDIRNALL
jgi:hypothetical protein